MFRINSLLPLPPLLAKIPQADLEVILSHEETNCPIEEAHHKYLNIQLRRQSYVLEIKRCGKKHNWGVSFSRFGSREHAFQALIKLKRLYNYDRLLTHSDGSDFLCYLDLCSKTPCDENVSGSLEHVDNGESSFFGTAREDLGATVEQPEILADLTQKVLDHVLADELIGVPIEIAHRTIRHIFVSNNAYLFQIVQKRFKSSWSVSFSKFGNRREALQAILKLKKLYIHKTHLSQEEGSDFLSYLINCHMILKGAKPELESKQQRQEVNELTNHFYPETETYQGVDKLTDRFYPETEAFLANFCATVPPLRLLTSIPEPGIKYIFQEEIINDIETAHLTVPNITVNGSDYRYRSFSKKHPFSYTSVFARFGSRENTFQAMLKLRRLVLFYPF